MCKGEDLKNLLKQDIAEAQVMFDQADEAFTFRRKTDYLGALRMQVAAAKALKKWYQARSLSVRPAMDVYNEALDKLNHHSNVKVMLKQRRQEACDRLWKLNKILVHIEDVYDVKGES